MATRIPKAKVGSKTRDAVTPPRYPPGDDPKISDQERAQLVKKHERSRLDLADTEKLLEEQRRIDRKIKWAVGEADSKARTVSSITTRGEIIRVIESLTRMGAGHRRTQSRNASIPRSQEFDAFLLRFLKQHPDIETPDDIFDALDGENERTPKGELCISKNEDDALVWTFTPETETSKSRAGKPISRKSFPTKLSRLRRPKDGEST